MGVVRGRVLDLGSGIEGDHPQKIACRFEMRGDIRDYARAAALTIVRRRPVVFREGEPPLTIRCADGSVHPEYAAVKLAVGFPP